MSKCVIIFTFFALAGITWAQNNLSLLGTNPPAQTAGGSSTNQSFQTAPRQKMTVHATVRDPNGAPLPGAQVHVIPEYVLSPQPGSPEPKPVITADSQGRFLLNIYPLKSSAGRPKVFFWAQDAPRNLAGIAPLDDPNQVRLTLQPAITGLIRVLDPNQQPLAGVNLQLLLTIPRVASGNAGSGVFPRDKNGNYLLKPLVPEQSYTVNASRTGYGIGSVQFDTADAENGLLKIPPIELLKADLEVAGKVIDEEEKPVAGIRVQFFGIRQPRPAATKTDKDGKFLLRGLVAGAITVSVYEKADPNSGTPARYGNIRAQAGTKDVVIMLKKMARQSTLSNRRADAAPLSLKGKPLPGLAGLNLGGDPNQFAGRPLLLCFIDFQQRPSRQMVQQLVSLRDKPGLAKITLVLIQAAPLDREQVDRWRRENKIDLPLGMLPDPQAAQRVWGVQSLPWLILTNQDHQVQAENLPPADLEKMLNIGS